MLRRRITFEPLETRELLAGVATLWESGPASNRLDLTIIGDGYTAGQIETDFAAHADSLLEHLLSEPPFDRYRNFINFRRVDVVSEESGVDDPAKNIFRNTALGGHLCGNDCVFVDTAKTGSALATALGDVPSSRDLAFVSINTTKHAGAGGAFAVFAGGTDKADEIALHEMAHVLSNLGDEYGGSGVYPSSEPSAPNLTKSATGAKWQQWMGFEQPGIGVIGAYEGGGTYASGIYRPSQNSKMRSLDRPFDVVSREQMVLDVYRYTKPIDQFLESEETMVEADPTLWIDVVDPDVQTIEWYVDGQLVAGAVDETFRIKDFGFGNGQYEVNARVWDATDWVRLDKESLEQTVSWDIIVTDAPTLQVTVENAPVGENDGETAALAHVRRINTDVNSTLDVSLHVSDDSEATWPTTVRFLAGQAEVEVAVDAVDDQLLDGAQSVVLSASADGFAAVDDGLMVQDHEQLRVEIGAERISERGGQTTATVWRDNVDNESPLDVSLVALDGGVPNGSGGDDGDDAEITFPAVVTIPAGQASFSFPVSSVDDDYLDGDQLIELMASADGYIAGAQSLTIEDYETLELTIDVESVSENAGADGVTATIRRQNIDTWTEQTVLLQSDDTTEATVPASVTIPLFQASVTFPVTIVDDDFVDGTQTVSITASAAGFVGDAVSLDVLDQEDLIITFDRTTVGENEGAAVAVATVRRTDGAGDEPLELTLLSDDDTEVSAPANVTIPAGQTSVEFALTAVDDDLLDGTQTVRISATSATHNASNRIDVLDHEMIELSVDVASVAEDAGADAAVLTVTLPNQDRQQAVQVALSSSDGSELRLVETVTVAAGQSSVTVAMEAVDDTLFDGTQTVQVTAVATKYQPGLRGLDVLDRETWQNPFVAEDTGGDGQVSPVDALVVINRLNGLGPGELPAADQQRTAFIDVNGDGYVSSVDALLVINELNRLSGEGETVPPGLAVGHWQWGIAPSWHHLLAVGLAGLEQRPSARASDEVLRAAWNSF